MNKTGAVTSSLVEEENTETIGEMGACGNGLHEDIGHGPVCVKKITLKDWKKAKVETGGYWRLSR